MNAIIDYQIACEGSFYEKNLPSVADVEKWVSLVLNHLKVGQQELTVRFVENDESQALNSTYRGKEKPTNVLSFPFEAPPGVTLNLLGDLVICVPVIEQEAHEQNKKIPHHYAHMIVHGTLHLLGYDHIDDDQAETMEALEIHILSQLGIDDPYQEH
ncbi:rRNA maturation RNase YbeY [Alteromonas sp. ASW11-130]|uniref:rRNA maturation RNase YbeY n=1 Tax=Alteromonas sp. ASW11-130 TaxID=3015775 RepID=UPI002241A280|nr:rRNA maturation RNase YbeY [Alteromonas sp. ASW11-130]MCW8090704.1 rRNA maturation RNase YbeY [Alteromonas sp. ASW11-130]